MTRLVLLFMACLALAAGPVPAQESTVLDGRPALDPAAYAGLWREVARTPNDYQDNTVTEDGVAYGPCTDTTASYLLSGEDTLRVTNVCVRKGARGATYTDVAEGIATIVEEGGNRRFKIAFGPAIGRFFMRLFTGGGADYWVYRLGPVNAQGLYSWALVSGPDKDFLYVLSREAVIPQESLEEILDLARADGLPVDRLRFDDQGVRP